MRILIIKLTSMGDLMHAFPALTDAVKQFPGLSFDWVVDEGFAEVPKWHPAVNNIITTAHRRWKKSLVSCIKEGELSQFYRLLNESDYDVVVDFQSNLKSALVSWLRRGVINGYDKETCREKPAHWAYQKQFNIDLRQHAIERQRQLMAKILAYQKPDSSPDYGVDLTAYPLPSSIFSKDTLTKKYVVFVHNASWPTKMWPVNYWQELISQVENQGYSVLLPCGNDEEYERAQEIAGDSPAAIALPKMCLNDMAAIISNAKAAVCSDTGLAHLCAVAATPAITLYAVTDTLLIGTLGRHQQHIVADTSSLKAKMHHISVDNVWQNLLPLL